MDMKLSIIISALAAGTVLAAATAAYINREKLLRLRPVRNRLSIRHEREEKLPERYVYDHLRFGGLE